MISTPVPPPIVAPPASTPSPSFGVHWSAWICFAAALSAGFTLNYVAWREEPLKVVAISGVLMVCLVLLSCVPAVIAFFLSQRSRAVATIAFIVFLILGTAGHAVATKRLVDAEKQPSVPDETQDIPKPLVSDQRLRNLQEEFESASAKKARQQLADAQNLDQRPQNAGPSQPVSHAEELAALDEAQKTLDEGIRKYIESAKQLHDESPAATDWIKLRSDFARARQNIDNFQHETESIRRIFATHRQRIVEALDRRHVDAARQRVVLDAVDRKFALSTPIFNEMLDNDDRMIRILRSVADVLEQNWGKWHYDPVTRHIQFKSSQLMQKYADYSDQLDNVNASQSRLKLRFDESIRGQQK